MKRFCSLNVKVTIIRPYSFLQHLILHSAPPGSFGGTYDSEGYVNNSVNMTRALGDREAKFHEDNGFFSRGFAIVNTPEV